MNKKVFSTLSLFALIAYLPIQAFSCKNFLQTTQQKIVSTSSCLVNNAWRIAGTASFATAAVTTAIIAKNTVNDALICGPLSSVLTQNASRLLLPLGCSICGLLCCNLQKFFDNESSKNELFFTLLNNSQSIKENTEKAYKFFT